MRNGSGFSPAAGPRRAGWNKGMRNSGFPFVASFVVSFVDKAYDKAYDKACDKVSQTSFYAGTRPTDGSEHETMIALLVGTLSRLPLVD